MERLRPREGGPEVTQPASPSVEPRPLGWVSGMENKVTFGAGLTESPPPSPSRALLGLVVGNGLWNPRGLQHQLPSPRTPGDPRPALMGGGLRSLGLTAEARRLR